MLSVRHLRLEATNERSERPGSGPPATLRGSALTATARGVSHAEARRYFIIHIFSLKYLLIKKKYREIRILLQKLDIEGQDIHTYESGGERPTDTAGDNSQEHP